MVEKRFSPEDAEYLFYHPQAKIVTNPDYLRTGVKYKVLKNES